MDLARSFADEVAQLGYAIELAPYVSEDFPWEVTASRKMAPAAEAITTAEIDLGHIATTHGGHADGWGFYSPRPVPPETGQS